MNAEEIAFLQSLRGLALVENHLDTDPVDFALRHAGSDFPVAAVASQIKYLTRARDKLPSWYAARCLLPGRAFEQCSSETAAHLKDYRRFLPAHADPAGTEDLRPSRALDLSCGLGVDTAALAQHFDEVIAVEQDADLAAVTTWNLARLGHPHVQVQHRTAEDFLKTYAGPPFDLVYLDPDRRDAAGRRRFALEDCRPDVLVLRESLSRLGHHVLVKLSPMLDLTALRRALDPLDRITVIGVDNEVKEILVEWGQGQQPCLTAAAFSRNGVVHRCEARPMGPEVRPGEPQAGEYLLELDTSLYKAGLVSWWWEGRMAGFAGGMNHVEGYCFSPELPPDFPGRAFRVEEVMPYRPGALRKALSRRGIKQLNFSRRYFDVPLLQIRQKLGLSEGGTQYLLFTRLRSGERIALLADRIF